MGVTAGGVASRSALEPTVKIRPTMWPGVEVYRADTRHVTTAPPIPGGPWMVFFPPNARSSADAGSDRMRVWLSGSTRA